MKRMPLIRPVLLAIPVMFFALPLIILFKTSLEKRGIQNYVYVLTELGVEKNVMNSLIVAGISVFLVLAVALPAAFAFSKLRFPGKNALFLTVLMAMMIPGISISVPMVKIIRGMHLINNYFALILPYVALNSSFALILAKNFIMGFSLLRSSEYFPTEI